ncbi:uncharacterized protein LOC102717592 [Oryza brachyantha]|uniref:DUF4378 domain-containing protein n=1 Tax=Oryza brachyantha TaxID=4533 RepID=J3LIC6_ORYBR|nr:uncharacterized protein LOC102717592 [Oryza brachyantha]XP_015689472.1 uncharacterized protein LOC102717592 [Oryza brachyantha]XP_015689473.1 uncharacterized protein LOC102717592 [Oryza brachyantha]XP_040376643.1 uncharacterized protein LOC102717592 [Oryza brachyantha]
MRGVQDRKLKKKQDLQVLTPFPGCLGRMINMFDLSNGVVATKMLTEKAHRDVSPAGKDRGNAFKMAIGPFSSQIEDKKRDSQTRKQSPTKRLSSPTKRSGETPVKMLIEQDMWKEGMSGEEPLNVVARLMGLNDAAVHQSDLKSGKRSNKEYRSGGFDEHSRNLRPKKESKTHQKSEPCGGLNDQTLRMNISSNKYQGKEPSCEKRMTLVREKFAEAKRLATDEKLLHTKEFQEALQFLSSNKDLFLKFLDEPNPLLSNNNYEFQPVTPPSETKQITILKPSDSIKRNGSTLVGRQLYSDGDESEENKCRRHQSLNVSPANSTFSEPTRIVVLKPGLVKAYEPKILRSPSSSSTVGDSEEDSMSAVDETVPSSRRLAKEITWQMRMRLKDKQDEENLHSYEFHDIYIGDDSFSKSEVENAKEISGEISEDLEFGTPTSGRSWDFLSRSGSPYSASCSSQTSHRREPSVVREAKKRILERLSMVSSTVSGEEEREARRSTGTLGEMLTIPEVKKDQVFGDVTLENTTPEMDSEEPFLCLPRSRSVPISLSFGGIELNGVATGSHEVEKEKNRKSLSFREKVSSLFSKNKKTARGKLDSSEIPSTNDRLKHGNTATASDFNENTDHSALDNPLNCTSQNADEISMPTLMASSWHSNGMENIPAKDISSIPVIGAPGIFGESQDQPSPVSVLDGPFLSDNNRSLLCSSESFISASPQTLSRSPLIGSFSRSLSWEDPPLEVMSPNSLRLSRLFSKADEDQDSLTFIQKLVCSAGIDRDGCMLASPLELELLEKFSDYQEEGIKLRERRSKEKFLFDAVNEALTELTWTAELMAYPWRRSFSLEHKDCENDCSNSAADEIWRVIRNWSILDRYPPGETIERNLLVEMILKREVVEAARGDMTRLETFELTTTICAMVLEDLIADAAVDLSV